MVSEQSKLANFEKIVLGDALRRKKEVEEIIEVQRKEAVALARTELTEQTEKKLAREQDIITRKNNEKIVKNSFNNKSKLLSKREELIDGLFKDVEKKIDEYVKSEEYVKYMKESILDAKKRLTGSEVKIRLCERDRTLNLSLDGFSVEYVSDDIIGGYIMIDLSHDVMIDETFELKITRQREQFLDVLFR